MNKSTSRTSPEDIQILTELYEIFQPQELHFLIELNERWSRYDPNRIQNMTNILRQTFAFEHKESDTEQIIKYFDSQNCIRLFPSITVNTVLVQREQTVHLNPYVSTCPICSSILIPEMADVLPVQIYTLKGKIYKGTVFSISCRHINTSFNMQPTIHVFPNYFRQDKLNTFTSKSLQNGDMIYLGGKQVFERALIENYTCQLLGRASSWQKFVDGLNLGAFNSNLTEAKVEWRKKLAMAFIKYKLIEFDLSIGSTAVTMPSSASEFDEWMWSHFPRLLSAFVYLWSNHKTLIGACAPNCSQCVIIDGHQKCRRRICRAKHVQISTEEFTSLTVGCCRTPLVSSQFCDLHQNFGEKNDATSESPKEKASKIRKLIQKVRGRKYRQRGFGATNCRTIKERSQQYVERCSRSFGILAMVTNCKIIIAYSEIFRSETLREIIALLCSTIRASDYNFPKCGVYDDGFHLVEFIRNHFDQDLLRTSASQLLHETRFSVDKTHFRGHIGRWCRIHMNPYKNEMLNGVNTQAAEQLFSWVKGYANILSSLSWRKMPLYLLLLFHYKNLERVNIRPTHIFNIISSIPNVPTISLPYMADMQQRLQNKQSTNNQNTATTVPETTRKQQAKTNSDHPPPTKPSSRTTTKSKVVDLKSVQSIVDHIGKLAQIDEDKKNREYQRKQRKNQARRKQ